jgi:hypothetical protein
MPVFQESSIFFIPGMPRKIEIVLGVKTGFLHPVLGSLEIDRDHLAIILGVLLKDAVVLKASVFKIPQVVKNEI